MAPNSPRDSDVGVVMPRAMKPDWVSKSKLRQTMWRGMQQLIIGRRLYDDYNITFAASWFETRGFAALLTMRPRPPLPSS